MIQGVEAGTVDALAEGRFPRPFDVLGRHPHPEGGWVVRVFLPWATEVRCVEEGAGPVAMDQVDPRGLWILSFPEADAPPVYTLEVTDAGGTAWPVEDPYRFGPAVDEDRVVDFLKGRELRAHEVLGAAVLEHEEVTGTRFAVWAPHAQAVGLAGDMNEWDARCHPMRPRGNTGVWELFVPGVGVGTRYKYRLLNARGEKADKADPFGRAMELRPATASEVWDPGDYDWTDVEWLERRARTDWDAEPMSVYEVHLGSWRRPDAWADDGDETGQWLSYRELADELLPYVSDLGFTHVELMPILEHPLDQSWGYQPVGFFAPTARHGEADDFRYFVDRAHRLGIGVLLDWVPGHFPSDGHGLVDFDGTPLFEDADPLQARHPDWGTLVFDYGKPPVRSFLVSSAIHWLEDYHLDGLRVDAVASMLYLDYSRPEGGWTPNVHGGRENLEAVGLLTVVNDAVHAQVPGALMVAEESTAWPRVSHGTDKGGLGFDQKWNMGWMNDTLEVMSRDPVHRRTAYEHFTFPLLYAFSERFVLPLSHDEVVHGKGSLLAKMPGKGRAQFANLRLLLAWMWAHPGKKLLFMGGELGSWDEWDVDGELDWGLEDDFHHTGVQRLGTDLNRLYRSREALHLQDFHPDGFEWLDCHDAERTTLSFLRWAPGWEDFVAGAANFTPVHRDDYRLPVPFPGRYKVVLNTDAGVYGGNDTVVPKVLESRPERFKGRDHVLDLPLPGLTLLFLEREG